MKLPSLKIPLFLASLLAFVPLLQAKLVFEQTSLEIESDLLDEETVAVFRFTNEGDKPLTILELKSSCGCTVPQLEKKQYAPGESGEIRAVFKFGGRKGQQRKRVTVITNDESKPVHKLQFSTTIKSWAELEPKILRWSAGGELEPKEVRLRNLHPDQIEVSQGPNETRYFKLSLKQTSNGESVYTVVPLEGFDRITERFSFILTASDGEKTGTRQIAFHCLIR